MPIQRKNSGFNIIELLLVVTIIGIVTAISIPSYNKYVYSTKLSEAYNMVSIILKSQLAHYGEHKEFFSAPPVPSLDLNVKTMPTDTKWEKVGYPAPVGSNLHFSYVTYAGRIDGSGTQSTDSVAYQTSSGDLYDMSQDAVSRTFTDGGCCNCGNGDISTMITAENSLDWAIITATADLNGNHQPSASDTLCTTVIMTIRSAPSTDSKPNSSALAILNKDE